MGSCVTVMGLPSATTAPIAKIAKAMLNKVLFIPLFIKIHTSLPAKSIHKEKSWRKKTYNIATQSSFCKML